MLYKGRPKRYKVNITKVNYEIIFKVKYTCYKIITIYRYFQMEGSQASSLYDIYDWHANGKARKMLAS